jgi:hypothetical protein
VAVVLGKFLTISFLDRLINILNLGLQRNIQNPLCSIKQIKPNPEKMHGVSIISSFFEEESKKKIDYYRKQQCQLAVI